jgi:hypothetical protein
MTDGVSFQKIIDLDRKIIDQLETYLTEEEKHLALLLFEIFLPNTKPKNDLQLTIIVEDIDRIIHSMNLQDHQNWLKQQIAMKEKVNASLWHHTEVLESAVVELFETLKDLPIDRWQISITHVVHRLKDLLFHHLESFIWLVERLEQLMKGWFKNREGFLSFPSIKSDIDPQMIRHLKLTKELLDKEYNFFTQLYQRYTVLRNQTAGFVDKLKASPIYSLMENREQNIYSTFFRLLKILQLNGKQNLAISNEVKRALKHFSSSERMIKVLQHYLNELTEALYKSSLEWKYFHPEEQSEHELVKQLQGKLIDFDLELKQLMLTMSYYRAFLLKSESNPYVGSRFGFSEWIVGPEPTSAKKIMELIYQAEELHNEFQRLNTSLLKGHAISQEEINASHHIVELRHVRNQPLISKALMTKRIEELLRQIKDHHEIGSPDLSVIDFMTNVFSKALKADWKYNVLHGFPLFAHLYRLHQGLIEHYDDPAHAIRLARFNRLFEQIAEWVNKGEYFLHVSEIELDISDMKTYLQDFLAVIQRTGKELEPEMHLLPIVKKLEGQLLEYRYFFGKFFYLISSKSREGQQLRNQFLFVNQYFDSMENLIEELKQKSEEEKSSEEGPEL